LNQTRRAERDVIVTLRAAAAVILIALYAHLLQKYSELWVMVTGVGNHDHDDEDMIVLMKGKKSHWTRTTEVF
jgi:hypothetical protein